MKIIVYGGEDRRRIESRMGSDEYSYHFVIEAFRPVLERIGEVHTIGHLDEVEPLRSACENGGESCVILSFVPPHKTTLFMRVPLLPVFAWEYETIPFETWDGQPKHDWRMVLQQQGRAITLSSHSAAVVRATMGERFPVIGIPPPVFDRWTVLRDRIGGRLPRPVTVERTSVVMDSAHLASVEIATVPSTPTSKISTTEAVVHEGNAGIEKSAIGPRRQEQPASLPVILARRTVGLYRRELRPFTPSPVARIVAAAGRGAWQTSRRLQPVVRQVRASLPVKRPPFRQVVSQFWSGPHDAKDDARQPAPQPVFAMPPPLDSLPIPLPLAEPIFFDVTRPLSNGPTSSLRFEGVVYFSVVNPHAGRKNWNDLISAFTWAFRDNADAVLVVKIVGAQPSETWATCLAALRKQPAFACRVVLIFDFLDREQMSTLLEASSYVVNTSSGEGCALPLLEGMAVGRPAVTPDHTAMADYVTPDNSFIVRSHLEVTAFPHDGRVVRRTMWRLPRWDSLRDAFVESYQVAKHEPDRWLRMSEAAILAQRAFCRDSVVERRLRDFLGIQAAPPSLSTWARDLTPIPVDVADELESLVE